VPLTIFLWEINISLFSNIAGKLVQIQKKNFAYIHS